MLLAVFRREVTLAFRRGGGAWNAVFFFLLMLALLAVGLGPERWQASLPGVLAAAAFLSVLFSAQGIFEADAEDGNLEQYLLMPVAFELLVLAKLAAHWFACLLPVTLLAPLAAWLAGEERLMFSAFTALCLAMPSLLAVAAFASALTLGSRKSGPVQALIALPLYIPPLIFSVGYMQNAETMPLLMLWTLLMLLLPLGCLAIAALLRGAEG